MVVELIEPWSPIATTVRSPQLQMVVVVEQSYLGREVVAEGLMIGIAQPHQCFQPFGQWLLVLQVPGPSVHMSVDTARDGIEKTVLPIHSCNGRCALKKRKHSFQFTFVEPLRLLAHIVTYNILLGSNIILVTIGIMVAVEAQLQAVLG